MAGEDPDYLRWIKGQRCCAPVSCSRWPCDAHHSTVGRGKGQKSHDHESMPLCRLHHMEFHAASGPFHGWIQERRAKWQRFQTALHRECYKGDPGGAPY
jgi:hypothetical protein